MSFYINLLFKVNKLCRVWLSLIKIEFYWTDGGDMDARDFVRMQYERRLREGLEDTSLHSQTIGSFERFTKVRVLCFSEMVFHYCSFFWAKSWQLPSDLPWRDLAAAWWRSRAGRMVMGWEAARLESVKLLTMTVNIHTAKEALGV